MTSPTRLYRKVPGDWNKPIELPLEEVRNLYASGLSMREVGEHFSVNAMIIHKIMKRNGITPRTKGGRVFGEAHHAWKGNSATYGSMHERLDSRFGKPKKCEECGTIDPQKRYDWANITGDYGSIDDFKRLCRSCHRKFDI